MSASFGSGRRQILPSLGGVTALFCPHLGAVLSWFRRCRGDLFSPGGWRTCLFTKAGRLFISIGCDPAASGCTCSLSCPKGLGLSSRLNFAGAAAEWTIPTTSSVAVQPPRGGLPAGGCKSEEVTPYFGVSWFVESRQNKKPRTANRTLSGMPKHDARSRTYLLGLP